MAKPVVDPWLLNSDGTVDPFSQNIDWHMPDLPDPDEPLPSSDPVLEPLDGLEPEIVVAEGGVVRHSEPAPVPPPEPEGPETMELEDGTLLTIEKERGQWKGSVAGPNGGNPQVYWGKNLKELIFNTLKAQSNATKKIREQNIKLKLGNAPVAPVAPQPQPNVKQLTADEIFEISQQAASNPDLAYSNWFQKKTGLTVEQLVALAQQGQQAANDLRAESVNTAFRKRNPDFYPDDEGQNFKNLIQWVAKFKTNKIVRPGEELDTFYQLVSSGAWSVPNIEEAFEDLSRDDMLIKAPYQAPRQAETPPPVAVQPNEPAPAPRPDSRIVSTVVRPRAATGIRQTDVTPVRSPEAPKAPSVEDFENMTDAEVAAAIVGVRKLRAQSRR